jgi:hypothetical protein
MSLIAPPMAVVFVVLLLAGVTAMLGLRRVSVMLWLAALVAMVYAFQYHATSPLNLSL